MPGPTSKRAPTATVDTTAAPPKPTVFYIVRVDGDTREDVARSATKADAEKHVSDLLAQKVDDAAIAYDIEERDGEY